MADDQEDLDLEAKKRALSTFNPESTMEGLSQIESSGGQFRDHPVNESGIQSGTKAVSSYGLMPNTVYEFAKRNKEFQVTPEGKRILETRGDPNAINNITRDPVVDHSVMQRLLLEQNQRLAPHYQNTEVTPEMANVLANRRGVSGAIKSIQSGAYKSDPYLQRFMQLKNKLKPVS
jgi:hypothetical protein